MPAPEIKAQAFMPNGTFKEVGLSDYKVVKTFFKVFKNL